MVSVESDILRKTDMKETTDLQVFSPGLLWFWTWRFCIPLRFAKAMKLMEERARVPLFLTYRAVGSGHGSEGVCWWQQQRVSWLVLAAVLLPGQLWPKIPGENRPLGLAFFIRSIRTIICFMFRYKSYSHFGAGDIPMSQSNYNTMTTHSESMVSWQALVSSI